MTDPAIIAASYAAERNYSHNSDDVIDASDSVGAWGIAKESTAELVDLSGTGNDATIHGAMPAEGFIQGRRFDGDDDYMVADSDTYNYPFSIISIFKTATTTTSWLCSVVDATTSQRQHSIWISSDGTLRLRSRNPTGYDANSGVLVNDSKIHIGIGTFASKTDRRIYVDGVFKALNNDSVNAFPSTNTSIGRAGDSTPSAYIDGIIYSSAVFNELSTEEIQSFFNTIARLPFWTVNYTDYPDNVTIYNSGDNIPYSSNIISSGTFKVDDDKLQCVSAGTMTYSSSYEFDGSEYIKVEIGGVEYAGTGTTTQGNTTVSVAQGSNKVTIEMGTGNTIDEINIQFRKEVN